MNGKGLIIARHGATLRPCALCRKPNPPEQLAGTGLCAECWVAASQSRPDWTAIPMPLIQQANHGAALASELAVYQGERGVEEPGPFTLRRLLEERRRLAAWVQVAGEYSSEDQPIVRCCYCQEIVDLETEYVQSDPDERDFKTLQDAPGLPVVWACRDREACGTRINAQVQARFATAGQRAS